MPSISVIIVVITFANITTADIIICIIITVFDLLLQVDAGCCSCAIHSSICWAAFSARVTQVRPPPKFAVSV